MNDVLNEDKPIKITEPTIEKQNTNMAQDVLLVRIALDALDLSAINENIQAENFSLDLDKMYQDIDESFEKEKQKEEMTVEVATGISVALTAGFVAWFVNEELCSQVCLRRCLCGATFKSYCYFLLIR